MTMLMKQLMVTQIQIRCPMVQCEKNDDNRMLHIFCRWMKVQTNHTHQTYRMIDVYDKVQAFLTKRHTKQKINIPVSSCEQLLGATKCAARMRTYKLELGNGNQNQFVLSYVISERDCSFSRRVQYF